ncbi:MAG: coniferyl aldehyde dehydrogenase [Sulfurifustaceae bacterium]
MATVAPLPTAARETTKDELTSLFKAQKAAFLANIYPSYGERIEALNALEAMVKRYRKKIEDALQADFVTHPPQLTAVCEIMGPIERARFARKHLKRWLKPQPRAVNRLLYGFSKTYVLYQPVGVVGNISPWNFPIDLSVGPLADILAAGNRAILKPSEMAPASAELVKEMITATYNRDHVAVVTGGLALAQEFTKLPWDHLLYTGGPTVGRMVMKAAAENLTPVTLELGGKCPTIVCADSVDEATVANILATKIVKNGQMCITADYVFVPQPQLDRFVSAAQAAMAKMMPSYTQNPQSTGVINERHLERLQSYVKDAREKGARVIELSGAEVNRKERKLPFTVVLDPRDDMEVMRNEIFGPILPIKTYRSLDEVIAYINAHERPLALYIYTKDAARADAVLTQTISGGACVNTAAIHAAVPSLPFGGIGNSGMGRHHGFEGFVTFSHQKAVFKAGFGYNPKLLYPPYSRTLDRVLNWLLK